ncbi:Transposon Tf2-9 polyprotein [Labeo rohita]|uniref:Transposon Tf2-9 polyprotein n=1 Tax=Labeo rohita TaxID=84645 RepID=A0ABQ8L5N2_LABRO|nr:Transposon Tf2-9 polyprotein [Labeo rohita]
MLVHLFGAVSSPSCANYALKKTAEDNEGRVGKEVLNTIRRNFYVDDCLTSLPDEDAAISLIQDLRAVCATGGFRLTKWTSNNRSVLASIPNEEKAKEVKELDLDKDKLPVERALGIQWSTEADSFYFKINLKEQQPTKRTILSTVNSIYDPIGFLAPLILPAKRIQQELCRVNCGWDDKIPDGLIKNWEKWLDGLNKLNNLSIHRCFKPSNYGKIQTAQLHHFSDASEEGYGIASYLRFTNITGAVHVAFVLGKARVAPLKPVTIPRLELAAAVLAAQIDRMIKREIEIPCMESVFWTDSTSVLKYIFNDTTRFKTYVANRVRKIRDLSEKSQWRYVNGFLNPADAASRGLSIDSFLGSDRWLHGPEFLLLSESNWPCFPEEQMNNSVDDSEVKKEAMAFSTVMTRAHDPINKFIEHFSSWNSLKRATAWILKFKKMLRLLSQRKKDAHMFHLQSTDPSNLDGFNNKKTEVKAQFGDEELSVEDIIHAEKALVCFVQQQSFKSEILSLKKGHTIKKGSSIYRLDPFLEDGILRVGGRLHKMAIPEDSKHQAILPKNSHLSTILLNHIHQTTGHCGKNQILSKLRQRFWIVHANSAARRLVRNCLICRRWNAPVMEQKMADLPLSRLTCDSPPFTCVGTDYFGPVEVKRGRSLVKRYGVLFTCLVSRAIHLELAFSLEINSCIMALRRFICRRGQVQEIISDNGTNYVGAERELRDCLAQLNHSKIRDAMLNEGIKWSFNPPSGPHYGGVWERLIRTIKKTLYSVLKQQVLDDEGLQTALCEVEAIVNDRPITTISDDVTDPEPLTPNHLLLLKGKPILPPGLFTKNDLYSRRRWRQVQYICDLFWRRWTREYLPLMQERQKWHKVRKNLKLGDIVLIVDDTSPRNSWPVGRIIKTLPDKRGHVRRVLVKTKSNILERPINKLCLLQENLVNHFGSKGIQNILVLLEEEYSEKCLVSELTTQLQHVSPSSNPPPLIHLCLLSRIRLVVSANSAFRVQLSTRLPTSLDGLVDLAIRVDTRLQQRDQRVRQTSVDNQLTHLPVTSSDTEKPKPVSRSQDFSWVPLSSWFFFTFHMGRNSQSPSSQNIFGVHHSLDPEERDRDSKTTTATDEEQVVTGMNAGQRGEIIFPPNCCNKREAREEYISDALAAKIICPSSSPAEGGGTLNIAFFLLGFPTLVNDVLRDMLEKCVFHAQPVPFLRYIISHPYLPDPSWQFVVEVDASEVGAGAILSQRSSSDKMHLCAYFSHRFSPTEHNYDIGNRELLAVKLALEEWRHCRAPKTGGLCQVQENQELKGTFQLKSYDLWGMERQGCKAWCTLGEVLRSCSSSSSSS